MLKKILPWPLCLVLALSLMACGPQERASKPEDSLTLAATTYPVYLFTCEVTKGAEDIDVTLMINQSVSCLHDYTLSVQDMKVLEGADVVILNGAGLEDSMADALDAAHTQQIDCSKGIELLASNHDHDHDHSHGEEAEEAHAEEDHDHIEETHTDLEGEADSHIWMDPMRACQMIENLAHGLGELDPANAALYAANAQAAMEKVTAAYTGLQHQLDDLACKDLITFHDGFTYFAEAFGLTILRSIEEEAGSEASAKDVIEILEEMEIHRVPAIFTETNGSTATALVIQRENGTPIFSLDMLMSGGTESVGIETYIAGIRVKLADPDLFHCEEAILIVSAGGTNPEDSLAAMDLLIDGGLN